MLWLIRKLTARGWSAAGAKVTLIFAAVVLALTLWTATSCTISHFRGQAKQAEVNTSQADAAADAGANALDVTRQTATKHTETDATVKDGNDAILNAPTEVDADLAAQCAPCRLPINRDARVCTRLRASGECQRFTPAHPER